MSIEMREVVVEQKQHVSVVVCDECKASVEVQSHWCERPLGWLRVESDQVTQSTVDFCGVACLLTWGTALGREAA